MSSTARHAILNSDRGDRAVFDPCALEMRSADSARPRSALRPADLASRPRLTRPQAQGMPRAARNYPSAPRSSMTLTRVRDPWVTHNPHTA